MATLQPIPMGTTLMSWQMPEFQVYERSRAWYVIASLVALALIIYAVVTTNYLFGIIVLIFAIILALTGIREPDTIEVGITETGVRISGRFFPYRDIAHFSIVYQPPVVKCLYLELKSGLHTRLSVHLEDQNPVVVRDVLREHLKEDLERTDEPFMEFLGRVLKL